MSLPSTRNRFDLENLFDHFLSPTRQFNNDFFTPSVDVKDKGDHYLIEAELPGVKKEDIHLEIHDGVLTLSAEVKQESKDEKGGKVIRQERRYGSYQRNFSIGESIHEEDISARFEDGILVINAPKLTAEKSTKKKVSID